jgi:hypothetical protein
MSAPAQGGAAAAVPAHGDSAATQTAPSAIESLTDQNTLPPEPYLAGSGTVQTGPPSSDPAGEAVEL